MFTKIKSVNRNKKKQSLQIRVTDHNYSSDEFCLMSSCFSVKPVSDSCSGWLEQIDSNKNKDCRPVDVSVKRGVFLCEDPELWFSGVTDRRSTIIKTTKRRRSETYHLQWILWTSVEKKRWIVDTKKSWVCSNDCCWSFSSFLFSRRLFFVLIELILFCICVNLFLFCQNYFSSLQCEILVISRLNYKEPSPV